MGSSGTDHEGPAMTLFAGLDLNATRARAVSGPGLALPRPLRLHAGADGCLPMAICLEGRRLEVGSAGLQICRKSPHLTCSNFLPYVGENKRWSAGRHKLDAGQALMQVWKRLQPDLAEVSALA